MSDPGFGYTFPAIRGVQARREFYVSMCPLRLIPRIFLFDDEELSPEVRAQRVLNRARIPELARYIVGNRDGYVFSAITASVDAQVRFEALGPSGEGSAVGLLHIPMDARFIINDGQHRRAAIEAAMRECTDLGDESIAVVFFLDKGLARSQQMFADLNRHAIRPSRSIGVLYDHRDALAGLTRGAVLRSTFYRDVVEMERTSLSPRSRKLFTLSAIYAANAALLGEKSGEPGPVEEVTVTDFWDQLIEHFPEWSLVRQGKMAAGEVRQSSIHSHGVVLQAIAVVARAAMAASPDTWRSALGGLASIDWSRANSGMWEGRAMSAGRVTKAGHNVVLTANAIKSALGLRLSPEEQRTEDAYSRGRYEQA
jgi:DNA sulfur modification protein DndB